MLGVYLEMIFNGARPPHMTPKNEDQNSSTSQLCYPAMLEGVQKSWEKWSSIITWCPVCLIETQLIAPEQTGAPTAHESYDLSSRGK